MKMRIFILAVLLIVGAGGSLLFTGCGKSDAEHPAGKSTKYHCPMHPAVTSDIPGDCSICGMKLVPMEQEKKEAPSAQEKTMSAMTEGVVGVQSARLERAAGVAAGGR